VKAGEPILIGKPIANTTFHVLDQALQQVPIGVPGELYIGGRGLARGYRNRDTLTAEKFISNPMDPGALIYRTGDLVRWHEDGNLECLGRMDHQVKLRGHRIELGEVEAALTSHPQIKEAAVAIHGDDFSDQRLVGYVVGMEEAFVVGTLQDYLSKTLPEYMVPSHILRMERLPRTANGKIDRKALPHPVQGSKLLAGSRDENLPLVGQTERALASIWAAILGTNHIARTENFFRIGGHSLTSVQLIAAVNRRFELALPVVSLFENPTIEALGRFIDLMRTDGSPGPAATSLSQRSSIHDPAAPRRSPAPSMPIRLLPRKENPLRGVKNRLLQWIARSAPNALRGRLHRWRGVKIGKEVGIGYDTILETSYPWLISIGDNARIGMRTTVIGHFAEMRGNVLDRENPSVVIGDDVWIGPNVCILPNVSIGRGAVVAAGSTVNRSVPPQTLVQGNPAVPVARCPVPMARGVTYDEFVMNLEPMEP
jgi:acetyltransferase-like isoleucine patch superfamily enzyme